MQILAQHLDSELEVRLAPVCSATRPQPAKRARRESAKDGRNDVLTGWSRFRVTIYQNVGRSYHGRRLTKNKLKRLSKNIRENREVVRGWAFYHHDSPTGVPLGPLQGFPGSPTGVPTGSPTGSPWVSRFRLRPVDPRSTGHGYRPRTSVMPRNLCASSCGWPWVLRSYPGWHFGPRRPK